MSLLILLGNNSLEFGGKCGKIIYFRAQKGGGISKSRIKLNFKYISQKYSQ